MKYQPFHDLPASQYEALKADIELHGVKYPIVVDEAGDVIDGHQRRRVCAELRIECPTIIEPGRSEDEKQLLVIALNAPLDWSTTRIAEAIGINQSNVSRALKKTEPQVMQTHNVEPDTDTSGSREPDASHSGAAAPDVDASGTAADSPSSEPNPAPPEEPRVVGKDGKSYPKQRTPRARKPNATKAVALALRKLADAAKALGAIDRTASRSGRHGPPPVTPGSSLAAGPAPGGSDGGGRAGVTPAPSPTIVRIKYRPPLTVGQLHQIYDWVDGMVDPLYQIDPIRHELRFRWVGPPVLRHETLYVHDLIAEAEGWPVPKERQP